MSGAAHLLGVHANTVRAWTDQGLLTCLRINARGDRRYRHQEIDRFLVQARSQVPVGGDPRPALTMARVPALAARADHNRRVTAVLDEVARLCASATTFDRLIADVAIVLTSGGLRGGGTRR